MRTKNFVLCAMAAFGLVLSSCEKNAPVKVASVKLSKAEAAITVGETLELKAEVLPDNAADKTVTWNSDKPAVATVDAEGKVTAVAVGEVIITATAKDGSLMKGECKVAVTEKESKTVKVTKITPSKNTLELEIGAVERLTADVLPDNATDSTVEWFTSATQYVTVDAATGEVKARAAGEATITAAAKDGSDVTGECKVTVKRKNGFSYAGAVSPAGWGEVKNEQWVGLYDQWHIQSAIHPLVEGNAYPRCFI